MDVRTAHCAASSGGFGSSPDSDVSRPCNVRRSRGFKVDSSHAITILVRLAVADVVWIDRSIGATAAIIHFV